MRESRISNNSIIVPPSIRKFNFFFSAKTFAIDDDASRRNEMLGASPNLPASAASVQVKSAAAGDPRQHWQQSQDYQLSGDGIQIVVTDDLDSNGSLEKTKKLLPRPQKGCSNDEMINFRSAIINCNPLTMCNRQEEKGHHL